MIRRFVWMLGTFVVLTDAAIREIVAERRLIEDAVAAGHDRDDVLMTLLHSKIDRMEVLTRHLDAELRKHYPARLEKQ